MRVLGTAALSLLLVSILSAAACAQDGVTIRFEDGTAVVYDGARDLRTLTEVPLPITVGNIRIVDISRSSASNRDHVGQIVPFRHALTERMADLDPRWDIRDALLLTCEAVDPNEPIGFRLRANARARGFHSAGSWLQLLLAPERGDAIAGSELNKRFNRDRHQWYVLRDLQDVYGNQIAPSSSFTIRIQSSARGSWWIKWLELKPWPTHVRSI